MSLALLVEVGGGKGGEGRITAAVGMLMTVSLLLASVEQFRAEEGGRWWLPLVCSAACAGWSILACRRSGRQPPMRLQSDAAGLLRLSSLENGESVDAVFVRGWRLGRLIWLHLRPITKVDPAEPAGNRRQSASVFGSGDRRFLLDRQSCDEFNWHALSRWLVWHGRSRRSEPGMPSGHPLPVTPRSA